MQNITFLAKANDIMAYVYLIGEYDNDGKYKIGSTRSDDINKRLNQLQTGNSSQLYLKDYFKTDHPFKLEKMLHNHFKSSNLIGEWFELKDDEIFNFKGICEAKEKILSSLKNNPYFFEEKRRKKNKIYGQDDLKDVMDGELF